MIYILLSMKAKSKANLIKHTVLNYTIVKTKNYTYYKILLLNGHIVTKYLRLLLNRLKIRDDNIGRITNNLKLGLV